MLDRLLDFVVSILRIFQFWVVIYPYEKGVHLRLGKYIGTLGTGLHFCYPFKVDRVIAIETVIRTLRLGAQSLVTADGKLVVVNTVVTCLISDPAKASLEVNSIEHVIDDTCSGLVAAFVANNDLAYIASCGATQDEGLLADCKELAEAYGIEIVRAQFTDISPSRTIRLLNSTTEAASYWAEQNGKHDRL
jgi:regulator of protease activity HflC (stomatin/prohibitin superfamily)